MAAALPDAVLLEGRAFTAEASLTPGDVVLLCVPDAALPELGRRLRETEAVVLHCAGSVDCSVLESAARGVFYPMVSFRERIEWSTVPVFAEAHDARAHDAIRDLARDLGTLDPTWTDSATRASYHLGAVFANNFSNHLVALLQAYCGHAGLDASVYATMLSRTVDAAQRGDATKLQTGPAARGDEPTLQRHLSMLPEELRGIYRALSDSIQRTAP
jgi:predicted short-subunit dehydrogenase-like oxidoreductase (DUF2520 family)